MIQPEVGKWYWVDTPAGMHRSHFLTSVPGGFKGQLYETDDCEKFMWISRSEDVIAEVEPENVPTERPSCRPVAPFVIPSLHGLFFVAGMLMGAGIMAVPVVVAILKAVNQ